MTEKQIERIKKKIEKYKNALKADKKFWHGWYHDGQGIRYLLPGLYIQMEDYTGGLRYLNWFKKNFPDDSGYPIFLFESAFILFKRKKMEEAEKKVYSTFFSNTYLFDKFLDKEILQFNKEESVSWEREVIVKSFPYKKDDPAFKEFAAWVETVLASRPFLDRANEYITLEQQLNNEPVGPKRKRLIDRISKIKYPEEDLKPDLFE